MEYFSQYKPTMGFYNQDDPSVLRDQIAAMQYGNIQAAISSWWGQGHATDRRFSEFLNIAAEMKFLGAVYMEQEGYGNPSVKDIRSDLGYLKTQYSKSTTYLKVDGRMVVFVYADKNDACDMVSRWVEASQGGFFLVLKVFPGYRSCADQSDAWHQYSPASAQNSVDQSSFPSAQVSGWPMPENHASPGTFQGGKQIFRQ